MNRLPFFKFIKLLCSIYIASVKLITHAKNINKNLLKLKQTISIALVQFNEIYVNMYVTIKRCEKQHGSGKELDLKTETKMGGQGRSSISADKIYFLVITIQATKHQQLDIT